MAPHLLEEGKEEQKKIQLHRLAPVPPSREKILTENKGGGGGGGGLKRGWVV